LSSEARQGIGVIASLENSIQKIPAYKAGIFCYHYGMGWATKKRAIYLTGILIVLAIIVSIPVYFQLTKVPNCFDGKQNGSETGIDLGGSCDALNPFDLSNMLIHWSRPFKVVSGVYDSVAYVENPNFKSGIPEIIYKFKLYDENNILIVEKYGKTFVGPNEQFAIFEGGLKTGDRIPKRVFFEFAPDVDWQKIELPERDIPQLSVRNQEVTNLDIRPRLNATIVNNASFSVKDIDVVAILYGADDNAIAVSATTIEKIEQYGTKDISFTWQEPFSVTPVRIDVIPRINLFTLSK